MPNYLLQVTLPGQGTSAALSVYYGKNVDEPAHIAIAMVQHHLIQRFSVSVTDSAPSLMNDRVWNMLQQALRAYSYGVDKLPIFPTLEDKIETAKKFWTEQTS